MSNCHSSIITSFSDLGLISEICKSAEKAGFIKPTPIQREAIPPSLEGRDLLLPGQTGTGKTAAFLLPALQNLLLFKQKHPKNDSYIFPYILVLEPTRDLAQQTTNVCRQLARPLGLKTRMICGGTSREQQCKSLEQGADIIVATHGRLLDLVHAGDLVLSEIAILILDEADRLLDEEFTESMTALIPYLADRPQTIFCSATLPAPLLAFAKKVTRNPLAIEPPEETITPKRIKQRALFLHEDEKETLLLKLFQEHSLDGRAIIFVKTKITADKLARILKKHGFNAISLHGGQTQGGRKNALSQFQEGQKDILVTTDIAARGLDIEYVTLVVNLDLPNTPEIYVHRIGRTARAGRAGTSLTFITLDERSFLREIERHIQHRIRIITPETLHI